MVRTAVTDRRSRARLAAVCVLLSVAVASCTPRSVSAVPGSPGPVVTPVRMTGTPTDTAIPTTPVPAGCPSGVVTITHSPAQTDTSTVCIKAGARLRLILVAEGTSGWTLPQLTPDGAATVTSTTDSAGNVYDTVTPAGAVPFCLSTDTTDPTAVAASWRLCVTIRR